MKRNQAEELEKETNAKLPRVEDGSVVSMDAVEPQGIAGINEIQDHLLLIDEECASEQMLIQKKFDEKKKPWFEKRQALIDNIPGFWCEALEHHPALSFITQEDLNVLSFLRKIDLEDNIDKNGSYRISFTFLDEAKDILEPLTISKLVTFKSEKEIVIDCTDIKWKPGKNPIEKARQKNSNAARDWNYSLFEWFSKDSGDRDDLGEAIRRDIWHSPVTYFLGDSLGNDGDGDFDEDIEFEDDDEDDEDAEEEEEDEEEDEDEDNGAEEDIS